MHCRRLRILLIVMLVVPLSGCPMGIPVQLGTWLFIVKVTGQDSVVRAITLTSGGQTQAPNPVPAAADEWFVGTTTWDQSGSTFTMVQLLGQNQFFTGTVHSNASMSGTWSLSSFSDPPVGSWAAVYLPE